MKPIRFSREEVAAITAKLRPYFRDELDVELRDLPAEMLIDFLAREIGPFFYNRALYDAQAVLKKKADDLAEAVAGLERSE
ncbi:MAG: DUF2164 domain-containing protein [Candidatus Brevundimonas colombiensis]|uniref:DUF2164 domain-containing protein n=1 Tax=Candidatus Brevundimonas colombiensis TaxID=3121376 RepID=A0AAJ5WZJ2_9CAUL|nr:DUF2164 domain-containing protein [Brevundimonas sp.]WEK39655.1 MAG: DUF2164 domain-containing protein [Brevundimonas sp.]